MVSRSVATVLTLALVGLAAGCGASSSKPSAAPVAITTTTTPSQQGGVRRQPAAFLSCLKQHGVTFPSGGFGRQPGGSGGSPPTTTNPSFRPPSSGERQKRQAAFTACQKYALPGFRQGFGQGFGRGSGGRGRGQFARYAACMKSHGVTIDPGPGRLDLTSPKFKAAAKLCRSLLPTAGAGGPATGTTPSGTTG